MKFRPQKSDRSSRAYLKLQFLIRRSNILENRQRYTSTSHLEQYLSGNLTLQACVDWCRFTWDLFDSFGISCPTYFFSGLASKKIHFIARQRFLSESGRFNSLNEWKWFAKKSSSFKWFTVRKNPNCFLKNLKMFKFVDYLCFTDSTSRTFF